MNNIEAPFDFIRGATELETPLLVSMPHSGLCLTPEVETALTDSAKKLPDTDWYLPELYHFLPQIGVACIKANYSRYVIDLNRPVDDKPLYSSKTTGLFPNILFDETPVFKTGKEPNSTLKESYKKHIWHAYHAAIEQELQQLKQKFGYAILFDAHSIAAQVPMLFEGTLPDFNWGTNGGESCSPKLGQALMQNLDKQYSQITNGRFKGGYITRHFGQPAQGIHAIQLELSQATYLNDELVKTNQYQLDEMKRPIIQQQLKGLIEALINITL